MQSRGEVRRVDRANPTLAPPAGEWTRWLGGSWLPPAPLGVIAGIRGAGQRKTASAYAATAWVAGGGAQSWPCMAGIGSSACQVLGSREWTVTSQSAGCQVVGLAGVAAKLSKNGDGSALGVW